MAQVKTGTSTLTYVLSKLFDFILLGMGCRHSDYGSQTSADKLQASYSDRKKAAHRFHIWSTYKMTTSWLAFGRLCICIRTRFYYRRTRTYSSIYSDTTSWGLEHYHDLLAFTPTTLEGSDSRMEYQIYKHSTTFDDINCPTYFLTSSRTIAPASLSIFFLDPSVDYRYSDTGSGATGYIFSDDAFKFLRKGITDKTL
jgi:hypothetical protein